MQHVGHSSAERRRCCNWHIHGSLLLIKQQRNAETDKTNWFAKVHPKQAHRLPLQIFLLPCRRLWRHNRQPLQHACAIQLAGYSCSGLHTQCKQR